MGTELFVRSILRARGSRAVYQDVADEPSSSPVREPTPRRTAPTPQTAPTPHLTNTRSEKKKQRRHAQNMHAKTAHLFNNKFTLSELARPNGVGTRAVPRSARQRTAAHGN